LESYLKSPRGRMLVFLGPTPPDRTKTNTMTQTGLEGLLQEFNIDATNEQVYTFGVPEGDTLVLDAGPDYVILIPYEAAVEARHPIAVTFKKRSMRWPDCRHLRTTTKNPNIEAEPLMGSYGVVWTESDLEKRPLDQHRLMQRDRAELLRRCTDTSFPLVVAASERSPEPGKPGQSRKPKLLVFGSSLFLTNQFQGRGAGNVEADLVRSSIDWCRERYSSIGVQPKTYNSFIPGKVSVPKLIVIPTAVMLMAILGFGLVVWNARRR
ncbi:MAG TPA: hypothetical protein VKT80_01025, partial [Chloroflexota bacterium]|nr:hypothetical protein [Chloroflexota bacterium]